MGHGEARQGKVDFSQYGDPSRDGFKPLGQWTQEDWAWLRFHKRADWDTAGFGFPDNWTEDGFTGGWRTPREAGLRPEGEQPEADTATTETAFTGGFGRVLRFRYSVLDRDEVVVRYGYGDEAWEGAPEEEQAEVRVSSWLGDARDDDALWLCDTESEKPSFLVVPESFWDWEGAEDEDNERWVPVEDELCWTFSPEPGKLAYRFRGERVDLDWTK